MNIFKGIKFGKTYACTAGDYSGRILIFIEKQKQDYGFISTPTMDNMIIPKEQFDLALKNGIIEYIERVPRYVRNTAKKQFEENQRNSSQL